MKRLDYKIFSIELFDDWTVITDDLDQLDSPITFADAVSGVGAFQISVAKFKSGVLPELDLATLNELHEQFASSRGLENPFDKRNCNTDILKSGRSYQDANDFIRVWYLSNGKDLIIATYVCEWTRRLDEQSIYEKMIDSITF